MNKAYVYIKNHEEIWVDLHKKKAIEKIRLSSNPEYGSINSWKNHSFKNKPLCSEFTNEIYHYYYITILYNFSIFHSKNKISEYNFKGNNKTFYLIASFLAKENVKIVGLNNLKLSNINYYTSLFLNYTLTHFYSFGFILYKTITNIKRTKKIYNGEFALIHSVSSLNKIKKLNLKLTYFFDDINVKKNSSEINLISFYSTISFSLYLELLFKSTIMTHKVFKNLAKTSNLMLGRYGSIMSLEFFKSRIGHYLTIKKAYQEIFKHNPNVKFYSGERESRYGILAMKCSSLYSNCGVAIPHGMAYSYKYPLGLFGHVYYCTTQNETDYLKNLFNESKFIFDEEINNRIYKFPKNNKFGEKIILFTEPRRPSVNLKIIEQLTEIIHENIYVKVHPLENKEFYKNIKNIKFIENYDEAICSNICISRKSTILIEALYNESTSIAILVDEQDVFDFNNSFPSLSDPKIKKCYSFNDLKNLIKNEIKNT